MSLDKNAGEISVMKSDKSYFKRVKEFKYLEKTQPYQNSTQEEIKGMFAII
jgi:hypothetical protein